MLFLEGVFQGIFPATYWSVLDSNVQNLSMLKSFKSWAGCLMVVVSESYLLHLPSFPFTCSDAIFARMAYMFVWFFNQVQDL